MGVRSGASVEAAGGELNAYTSFDQTVFHVTISKHYVDTAINVISEMMGFPKDWTELPFLNGETKALKPTETQ